MFKRPDRSPQTLLSEKVPKLETSLSARITRAGLTAFAIGGLICASAGPAEAAIATEASQVQVVSTGSTTFVATGPLTWETLPKTKKFSETARNANFIELDADGVKFQLNIKERAVKTMSSTSKGWQSYLPIKSTSDISGGTINGFSVLAQKVAGKYPLVQIDLDQLYTSGGNPSGWRRAVYELAQGNAPVPTDGLNAMRIDTPQGVKFERMLAPNKLFPGKVIWAEYSQYGKMNEATGVISDPLATPAYLYVETSRDKWSIYLTSINRPIPTKVQIDLHKKLVTASERGGSPKSLYSVQAEPRPYFNQFIRTNFDVQTTAGIFLKKDALSFSFSTLGQDVSVDLAAGTCKQTSRANCQLLQGEYGPRSITGFSLGSIEWALGGQPMMSFQNHQYYWQLADLKTGAAIDKAKIWIPYSKSRTAVEYNLARLDLGARRFQFKDKAGNASGAAVPVTGFRNYYPEQFKNFVPIPYLTRAESPGFKISNRTAWPVYVQVGQQVLSVDTCYNRAIIKPGETVMWDTGAVWFDMKAVMNQETVPTDLQCATSAIIAGGTVAVTTAITVGSAGSTTPLAGLTFIAVRSAIANTLTWIVADTLTTTAANAGWSKEAQIGVNVAAYAFTGVLKSGMLAATSARTAAKLGTQQAAGLSLKTVAVTAGKGAVASVDEAAIVVAKAAAKDSALGAAWQVAKASGSFVNQGARAYLKEINEIPMTDAEIAATKAALTQEAKIYGQYAGHPFPWAAADRIRPAYVITGGPGRFVQGGIMFTTQQIEPMRIKACSFNTSANRYDCAGDVGL